MKQIWTGTIKLKKGNIFVYKGVLDIVKKNKSTYRVFSKIKRLTSKDALKDAEWLHDNYLGLV